MDVILMAACTGFDGKLYGMTRRGKQRFWCYFFIRSFTSAYAKLKDFDYSTAVSFLAALYRLPMENYME
jgi:hypothetical protein